MCSYLCASVCIYLVLCNFITFKSVYLLPQSRSWTAPLSPKSLLLLFYNHTYLPITLPHTFSENHKSVLQLCNSVISRVLNGTIQCVTFRSWLFFSAEFSGDSAKLLPHLFFKCKCAHMSVTFPSEFSLSFTIVFFSSIISRNYCQLCQFIYTSLFTLRVPWAYFYTFAWSHSTLRHCHICVLLPVSTQEDWDSNLCLVYVH